eukprot:UN19148
MIGKICQIWTLREVLLLLRIQNHFLLHEVVILSRYQVNDIIARNLL